MGKEVKRYLCDLASTTDTSPTETIKDKYVVLATDYASLVKKNQALEETIDKLVRSYDRKLETITQLLKELNELKAIIANLKQGTA